MHCSQSLCTVKKMAFAENGPSVNVVSVESHRAFSLLMCMMALQSEDPPYYPPQSLLFFICFTLTSHTGRTCAHFICTYLIIYLPNQTTLWKTCGHSVFDIVQECRPSSLHGRNSANMVLVNEFSEGSRYLKFP